MRYLYYCNSAYQILTVINLHWQRTHAGFEDIENYEGDLIILNSFKEAKRIRDLIEEAGLFHSVRLIEKAYNFGYFHALQTLTDVIFPAKYLRKKFGIAKKDVKDVYSVITVPKYSTITAALWQLNRKAKLHILEDGVGTYFGSMRLTPDSTLYRKLYRTFNHGRTFHDYEAIYLNDALLFTGKKEDKVVDIPKFDGKCLEMLRGLFGEFADCEDVKGKSVLYFAQFLNNRDINIFIDSLLEEMEQYRKDVLYIPHPRHEDERTYGLDYANQKQIWELKQLKIDDLDEKMLISIHSTACFTPKILFEREPYVMLFYDLCDDVVTTRNDRFDAFVKKFRERYSDPDKIMIPKSREEFMSFLNEFVKKHCI